MGSAIRNYQRRLSGGGAAIAHPPTAHSEKICPSTAATKLTPPLPTERRKTSIYLDHTEDGRPVLLPESRRVSLHPDYTSDKEYCKLLTTKKDRRASVDVIQKVS